MKNSSLIKGAIFVLIVLAISCSRFLLDLSSIFSPANIERGLNSTGMFAPLLYMAVMALAVIISPIPSLPLDIAAGAFFGPFMGTIYSVFGALAGAVISFMIARFLGRELIERFLGGHINFCPECSDKILTKVVFLSRFMPIVSFDIISYGAGLTKMSLKKFSIATFFGMIPLTFLYNYSGSVLVFGDGITFVLGVLMVVLFLFMPKWLEGTKMMERMKNEHQK